MILVNAKICAKKPAAKQQINAAFTGTEILAHREELFFFEEWLIISPRQQWEWGEALTLLPVSGAGKRFSADYNTINELFFQVSA